VLLTGGLTAALVAAPGAGAEPPPPCSYALSPPEISQVDGATMVAVTVAPADCGFPGAPGFGVACVQRQGDSMKCAQGRGEDAARVLAPYLPGATYVATGRGCGSWAGNTEQTPNCQMFDPISATL
jgi:hypothetical protein